MDGDALTPANTLWARTLVDELVRSGVTDLCLAPGSRSTPIVLAAAGRPEIRIRVHLDERSAGFFALGMAKAARRPVALVTTSGTATANLLPALVEAFQSDTPLVVLTADRPRRLRGSDANQTIDQVGIYGSFVRAFVDVAPASSDERELRGLRAVVGRAVADAIGAPAGPVHLNLPFEKPLEPPLAGAVGGGAGDRRPEELDTARDGLRDELDAAGGPPSTRVTRRVARLAPSDLSTLAAALDESVEGVLVAGPAADPGRVGDALCRLSAATGFPLLADPLSGARWRAHGGAVVLGRYDLYLRAPAIRRTLRPDLVLRVGQSPTSAAVGDWLDDHADVRQIVLDPADRWKDHGSTATEYLRADVAETVSDLLGRVRRNASGAWRERWSALERGAGAALEASEAFTTGHEGAVAVEVLRAVRDGDVVFVASSMPVRDLDAFGAPEARDVPVLAYGNRGASGIDGTVSTALGVASGSGRRVIALLGDLAFYHDMNGLLACRESDAEVVFVVVNNDGGGIFHMLPVRHHEPHFTPLFATPHGLDFRHAAAMFGLPYERVEGTEEVAGALARATGGSRVVEVVTDREDNERRRKRLLHDVLEHLISEGDGERE